MTPRSLGGMASYVFLLSLFGCDSSQDKGALHTGGLGSDTGTDVRDTGPFLTDADGDGYLSDDDCDDGNAEVNPGADEVCDGLDNDCNGLVDLDDPYVDRSTQGEFYGDADGDGYGTRDSIAIACTAPDGYAPYDNDCDEDNPDVNPGADEVCDDLDNDCNGLVDDSATEGEWYYPDEDDDGIGVEGEKVLSCSGAVITGDCDDTDPTEPQVVDASSTGLTAGSLAFPWVNIQDGIDNADSCVIVFAGTYYETIDFTGKSISVTGVEGPGVTTIDATGLGAAAVSFSGGETSDASLSGFTIQGGDGNLTESERSYTCGSRVTCYEYTTTYCGGGVYVSAASPTLSSLIIQDNSLGLASTTTSGTTTWYVSSFGGGLCVTNGSVVLTDSTIQRNYADVGGGLYLDESAQLQLERSWLVANTATDGAGLGVDSGSLTVSNVASAWNLASGEGGGVYMDGGTLSAVNVTWGEDDAPSGGVIAAGNAASITLGNSILYGSDTGACLTFSGSATLAATYNNLYGCAGGRATGVTDPAGSSGNVTANPMFEDVSADGDPTNDDWHLSASSPSIDRGDPSSSYNDADGSQNDQGAFGGPQGAWD